MAQVSQVLGDPKNINAHNHIIPAIQHTTPCVPKNKAEQKELGRPVPRSSFLARSHSHVPRMLESGRCCFSTSGFLPHPSQHHHREHTGTSTRRLRAEIYTLTKMKLGSDAHVSWILLTLCLREIDFLQSQSIATGTSRHPIGYTSKN